VISLPGGTTRQRNHRSRSDDPAYPALSIAGGAAQLDLPQQTGPRGVVAVNRLGDQVEAVTLLAEAAGQGVDEGWLRRVLDKGAHVYPMGLQWRTAQVLFQAGQIVAPSGLRGLIEAAQGDGVVREALELVAAVKADWPDWKRAAVAVCPLVDGAICDGLAYDRGLGLVFTS